MTGSTLEPDRGARGVAESNAIADGNPHGYADRGAADSDAHAHTDFSAYRDGGTHGHTDAIRDSHALRNADSNATRGDGCAGGDTGPNAPTGAHADTLADRPASAAGRRAGAAQARTSAATRSRSATRFGRTAGNASRTPRRRSTSPGISASANRGARARTACSPRVVTA
ncbi:MAG: hypothetical protein U5Q44_04405 [Dehalococcoidia bacterium]|nr:hypothetical protein [Dehalococcoidia bacterium]